MAAVTSAASAAAARIGAALSDAQYFESSMLRVEDIRRQLDSRSVKEKLDAMKRVVALISLGKDASTFFPDVVKNVVAPSLDVKKLVYLYLVHYAEEKQDLALLAINSFQKDLSDHNQHIRALSLRVLSSIRVKVILQVVILAISRAAKDSSAYVRKAAAHAIGKVCALDSSSKELLMEPLQDLVSDRSTQVMGSAVAAFEDICPDNYELIHPHYRRICASLVDVDPWGQITIVNMLLRYARVHFADPYNSASVANGTDSKSQAARIKARTPDLTLLLESVAPLFYSLNNSVVASAVSVYYHLASREEFCGTAVKPLMRLVSIQDDGGQAVALNIASAVAVRFPSVLIPYVSEFYVSAAHSKPVRALRMNVLTRICAAAGEQGGIGSKPQVRRAILGELRDYLFRSDKELAASAARAIGCLATAHPDSTPAIVKVLSSVVGSASNPAVVTESISVLRRLLQRHPSAQAKALPQLIAMLLTSAESDNDSIQEPAARASIIWLIGEFYEKVQAVATEALRLLARGFVNEAAEVKLQILNLAAKVVAWNEYSQEATTSRMDAPMQIPRHIGIKLLEHVTSCARYDRDYDVRDKARMLTYLFLSSPNKVLLKSVCEGLTSRKPIPAGTEKKLDYVFSDDTLGKDILLGSLSHVMTGRRLPGFRPLEPWADVDSDAALREEVLGAGAGAAVNREYKGVSSADYQGFSGSAPMSSSVWQPPTGISSASFGGLAGASEIVTGVHGPLGGLANTGNFTSDIVHVDPERFYESEEGSGKEESSEYDSSEEEDDDDDDDDEEANHNHLEQDNVVNEIKNISLSSQILIDAGEPTTTSENKPSTKRPSSEYDLDALLGGIPESPSIPENKSLPIAVTSPRVTRTNWTRLAESWKAGGLELDASFVGADSAAGPDVTPVVLRVTNRGKDNAKSISFTSRSGDCFECESVIPSLNPNGTTEVTTNARFRGKTNGVRFSVDINGKAVTTLEFKPTPGFVIRPHSNITPAEFMSVEKSLGGMFGSESTIALSTPKHNDWMGLSRILQEQLLEACFVAHAKTSVGGPSGNSMERFSILFAGYLPSTQISSPEKRPVLIRVTVRSGTSNSSCECIIWIGCEDVLFSANLMQICKTAVQAIDTPQ